MDRGAGPGVRLSSDMVSAVAQLAVVILAVIYGAEVSFAAVVASRLDVQTSELLGDHLEILARAASVVFVLAVVVAVSSLAVDAVDLVLRRWEGLPGDRVPQPSPSAGPSRLQASAGLAAVLLVLLVMLGVGFGAAGRNVYEILDDPDLSRELTSEQRLLLFLLPQEPRRVCVLPLSTQPDLPARDPMWLLNTRDGVYVLYADGRTFRVNSQNANVSSFNTDGSPCLTMPIQFPPPPTGE